MYGCFILWLIFPHILVSVLIFENFISMSLQFLIVHRFVIPILIGMLTLVKQMKILTKMILI